MSAPPVATVNTVPSKDGTEIGYELRGSGPGLVLVQGTMGTAYNFRDLTEAPRRHVHRRPTGPPRSRVQRARPHSHYSLDREIEDLASVLDATGARRVFGLSSGAIIALWAARRVPAVHGSPPTNRRCSRRGRACRTRELAAFDAAIAAGRVPTALVLAMKAGQFAPRAVAALPTPILAPLVSPRPAAGGEAAADRLRHHERT